MALLRILNYPDPRLRTKAQTVMNVQEARIQQIIADMLETLYHTPNCAGLAATQLDLVEPPRITVIDLSTNKDQPLCLINPEILHLEGEVLEPEGCMSVYPQEIHAAVKRPAQLKATALDRHGQPLVINADGFLAKCIQHEVDHLNGKLYIDHLSPLKRQRLEKKISKLVKT